MQTNARASWIFLLLTLPCLHLACQAGAAPSSPDALPKANGGSATPSSSASGVPSSTASSGGNTPSDSATTPSRGAAALSPNDRTSVTFAASTAPLLNPERGFFNWIDFATNLDFNALRAAGHSLGFAVVRLDSFRNSALSQTLLDQVTAGLTRARAAHIKVLLRFVYNYPGTNPDGADTQDAAVNIIMQHTQQLQPLLAANADVIVAVEAGFSGEWGEWHDSTSGLDTQVARLQVMNVILAAVPAFRYVLIRYPYEKRENWQGPLDATTAFGTSAGARIGHHNDCFLDGDDNAGTYHSADDKTYLAADTFYVPIGGETCAVDTPRTDCSTATTELAMYHWAFLNADFDQDVLNGWTACMTEINNRLGYRYTVQDASMNLATNAAAATLAMTVHINNSGYARMFNERPIYLVVASANTQNKYLLAGIDPRRWDPGANATINANVSLGTLAPGTYTIALWLPDAATSLQAIADYAVQFANVGMWDATYGYNVLTREFIVQ